MSVTKPEKIRIADFAERWVDELDESGALSPQTITTIRSNLRAHILPAIGEKTVTEVSIVDLQLWARNTALSRSSATRVLATLSGLLRGVEEETGVVMPETRKIRLKRSQEPRRARALTPRGLSDICMYLKSDDYRDLTMFLAYTGLRIGEALALEWKDTTLNSVSIVQSKHKDGRIMPTKTSRARVVHLLQPAAAVLNGRVFRDQRFVFEGVNRGGYAEALRRSAATCFLDWVHPHALRHTFASILLDAGAPITFVADQLGHSNPQTTLRLYSHWIGDPASIVENVNRAIARPDVSRTDSDSVRRVTLKGDE